MSAFHDLFNAVMNGLRNERDEGTIKKEWFVSSLYGIHSLPYVYQE